MCSKIAVSFTTGVNRTLTLARGASPSLLLPHAHATALLADLSSLVTNCHRNYARYAEIDAASANALITSMATAPDLTPTETDALDRPVVDADWRRIKGTVQEPVAYFQRLTDTAAAWGKAECVVDASAASVFGYLWNYNSYERLRQHEVKEKGLLHEELQVSANLPPLSPPIYPPPQLTP